MNFDSFETTIPEKNFGKNEDQDIPDYNDPEYLDKLKNENPAEYYRILEEVVKQEEGKYIEKIKEEKEEKELDGYIKRTKEKNEDNDKYTETDDMYKRFHRYIKN